MGETKREGMGEVNEGCEGAQTGVMKEHDWG